MFIILLPTLCNSYSISLSIWWRFMHRGQKWMFGNWVFWRCWMFWCTCPWCWGCVWIMPLWIHWWWSEMLWYEYVSAIIVFATAMNIVNAAIQILMNAQWTISAHVTRCARTLLVAMLVVAILVTCLSVVPVNVRVSDKHSYYNNTITFIMHDSVLDIDECSDVDNNCQQQCNNTVGSYLCSCQSGFHLNADGATCSSKNHWIFSPVDIYTLEMPARLFSVCQ